MTSDESRSIGPSPPSAVSSSTASSSKRSSAAAVSHLEDDQSRWRRSHEPKAASIKAAAQVTPPLLRHFYSDLKCHLLLFMTRHEVMQLGRRRGS